VRGRPLSGGARQRQGIRNARSASCISCRADPTIIPTWPD